MPDTVLAARAIELIQQQRRIRCMIKSAVVFLAGLAFGVIAKTVYLQL
jgi:hypothetical protein